VAGVWGDVVGMGVGAALDAIVGDPRRWHPVAGFGRFAGTVERRLYEPSRRSGVGFVALAVGAPVAAAAVVARLTRDKPIVRAAATAAVTWAVLGGTSLRREATAMADALDNGDLDQARERLPNLCGRDPSHLDEKELARATVESVAENTSDAVVGPLVWGAIAGLPGLVGYRAVNTLDAMVGHRSERYREFGWAAARLDDVANLVPARLTALLTVLAARRPGQAADAWRRDGHRHPSPNAGQCEAAFAGALGIRLGGRNTYAGRIEHRPHLNEAGRPPEPSDIRQATRLSTVVGLGALAVAVAVRAKR
jgi:adenosylcobinamide-phosphate synthase